jgi:hypothetical protein
VNKIRGLKSAFIMAAREPEAAQTLLPEASAISEGVVVGLVPNVLRFDEDRLAILS